MKRTLRFLPLALLPALASFAHAKEPSNFNAYFSAAPAPIAAKSATAAAPDRALGSVASIDEQRGVPTFFWAAQKPSASPAPALTEGWQALARSYVDDAAKTYGLSKAALETMYVRHTHDTGRGGVIVVFGQRVDGAPVFESEMKVLMSRTGDLVAIGGNLHADATPKAKGQARAFKVSYAQAIATAFADRYEIPLAAADLIDLKEEKNSYRYFGLKSTPKIQAKKLAFTAPSRARKVFYPMPDRVAPAYYLELNVGREDSTSSDLFGYVIAADTGALLMRRNLTSDAAFNYRVWADQAAPFTPLDGPQADYTPHPTGTPDGSSPAFIAPSLISIEGFNTNPGGAVDPWLAANATQSQGNNVDAYADRSNPDGFGGANDVRATTTAANTFDRTYNTAMAPASSTNQVRAAVTQLFYNVNWEHDYWYDSGFNESAGNAQASNFGRGGAEGDALLAEAQDFSGTNNANMSTPADGASPKMQMYTWSGGGGPQRDGTIDNTIVAHEWGHYLHHRLVACGSEQCGAQSEGWGDLNSVMLAVDSGENIATGTFGMAIYASVALGDAGYFGIRRFPYSRDMAKNGLTFKHVTNNVALPAGPQNPIPAPNWEVHNAGEIWTTMLFQAYTELLMNGGHTFTEAKRRMADYVVAGMIMAPSDPTFTEQRDGILAAANAADPADFLLLAQGFATRGAGSCAVSPARYSTNGAGVVESFVLSGQPALVSVSADDSIVSCDGDGLLDGLETGKLTIQVHNTGAAALTNTTVAAATAVPGISFPNGAMATIANIPPFGTGTATVNVAMDNSFAAITDADFTVTMTNAAACKASTQATVTVRTNYDDTPMSSTTEAAESENAPWTKWGAPGYEKLASDVWARDKQANGNHRFYGQDFPSHSDTAIESPDLVVSANQALTITFSHAFDFEASVDPMLGLTYWDGGLIEITKNGGQLWEDASMYANPGYNGTIAQVPGADNPLGARPGYVQRNAAWPNNNNVTLNFGNAFAGQTVKIRFRLGTDAAGGVPDALGWYIDNIAVSGITNMPFRTVTVDPMGCNNTPPTANAGVDQVVNEGALVTLNGSMSSDPDNDPLVFAWIQSVGTNVALSNPAAVMPTFTAPQVGADTLFTFDLIVDDGKATSMDSVNVLVKDVPVGTGGAGGMGAGGSGTGGSGTGGSGTGGMSSSGGGMSSSGGGMSAGAGGIGGGGIGGGGGDTGDDGGPRLHSDSGCGCEVPGRTSSAPSGEGSALASLAAALAFLSRRRRSRSSS